MTPTERRAWLRERQNGLGGTDIAGICGVGFRSAAEVYAEKVAPDVIDNPPTGPMAMGLATEEFNARLYAERTGRVLDNPGMLHSPICGWRYATFDRVAVPDRPVDLKYAVSFGDRWGDDGTDDVPAGYVLQLHWQMMVLRDLGFPSEGGDISAIDGWGHHRVYPIAYSARLAEMLDEIGEAFWFRVMNRYAVGPEWVHPLASQVEREVYAVRDGSTVELGDDALSAAIRMEDYARQKREAESLSGDAKAELIEIMKDHQTGLLPDGRTVKRKVVNRAAYTAGATSYIDMRIQPQRRNG